MSHFRTSGRNIWLCLVQEHRMVEQIHKQINQEWQTVQQPEGNKQVLTLIRMLIRDLSLHSHKEQILVYPLLERRGSQAQGQYEHSLHEHLEVEQLLQQLELTLDQLEKQAAQSSLSALVPLSDEVLQLVNVLMDNVSHHVQEEESTLIPMLKQIVPEETEEAVDLGRKWEASTGSVASHPHPDAPQKGWECAAANMAQADLDKAKDEAWFGKPVPSAPGKTTKEMADVELAEQLPTEQMPMEQQAQNQNQPSLQFAKHTGGDDQNINMMKDEFTS